MSALDDMIVGLSEGMGVVVADIDDVGDADFLSVGGSSGIVGDLADTLVVVFVFCHVSIGKLRTPVTIFPMTSPLPPLPRLRLFSLLSFGDPAHCISAVACL